ncbi:MAG: 6-phosphogluconolactonase [Bdellovibrionales bacterium]|nr:6-phosphogluconolactonase [Bdellovibrionales bacterium]
MPQIHKIAELDLLYADSARVFFEAVRKVQGERVVVAVPGGRSIVPFFNAIVMQAVDLPLADWHRLEFFMVDERAVKITEEDSNFRLVERHLSQLVDELILRKRQLHPYLHDEVTPHASVDGYLNELHEFGGAFDIVCLGIGEDGHVAALFPDHHSVRTAERKYFYFEDSPKPPAARVSASRKMIEQASVALLFAVGDAKLDAATRMLASTGDVEHCPARIVHSIDQSHVFTNLDIA